MIEAMPSSVTVKIKPIGPVASTDVEKTGLERVEIGIDKYPAIDFISGSTYTAATPETSLNPIKPIAKPNIESTDVEKHDGYSKFGFECDPKGAVLAKIRESKVPLDMVELEFWALDNKKVACADVFFEVIRQLRTEGLIFEPSPDKVAAVGSMGTGE
jgi:hypothetical protein